jgi:hypothetical protein
MDWIDEIVMVGPKDIYERAILVLDAKDALEFCLAELRHKDSLIKILTTILKQEVGDDYWQRYLDDLRQENRALGHTLKRVESPLMEGNLAKDLPF